jgi:hypothetical protein
MLKDLRRELPDGCISDLRFDEWRSGELGEVEAAELRTHIDTCSRCHERAQVLAAVADDFLARFPWATPDSKAKPPSTRPQQVVTLDSGERKAVKAWRWSAGIAGLAAAAGFAFVLRGQLSAPDGGVRIKGSAHMGFFVRRAGNVLAGENGQVTHPGDQLRFTVTTNEPRYLAILSRDGRGKVSEYYPGDGHGRAFGVSRNEALESSVELDEVLGHEEVWGVFCEGPFETKRLLETLERREKLQLPETCSVDRLELEKKAAL